MHALYDAQRKVLTIVNEQRLGITLIPEASLWLYRATKTNDTSYFYVCKQGENYRKNVLGIYVVYSHLSLSRILTRCKRYGAFTC